MENQTVAQKLEFLLKLQGVDSKLDQIKKLRGDLPEQVRNVEDEAEGFRTRKVRFENELQELENNVKKNKEEIKQSAVTAKKYEEQHKNVKNDREYNAITKEIELLELENQICEKRIKEDRVKIKQKKEDIEKVKKLIQDLVDNLGSKKTELNKLLDESQEEEATLLKERKKIIGKIEEKLLIYYERLRKNLSNGLVVVRVVRGAAEGCNIVIPPQKMVEIHEKKKIVIDEHSGRILADVDLQSLEKEKVKSRKKATPVKKQKLSSTEKSK